VLAPRIEVAPMNSGAGSWWPLAGMLEPMAEGSNGNQAGGHHLGAYQSIVGSAAVGGHHSDGPLPGSWKPVDQIQTYDHWPWPGPPQAKGTERVSVCSGSDWIPWDGLGRRVVLSIPSFIPSFTICDG
jgi:hypothetical protein